MKRWLLICAMTGVACGGATPPTGSATSTSGSAPPAPASEKRRSAPCLELGSDCGGDHECCDTGEVKCLPPLAPEPNPNKTVCRRP
jgi:hypothetical protein